MNEEPIFTYWKVTKDSGADIAGLEKGDIIVKLDNQKISSYSELSGYINTKRPKDVVQVTFIRNDKTLLLPVKLTKNDVVGTEFKGLQLQNIEDSDKKKFRIGYGVKIKDINNDKLMQYANDLKEGIILSIDNVKATDVETVSRIMANKNDNQSVQVEMVTKTGQVVRLIL